MTCRGVVRGNTILLEEQAHLPEGAAVEVRVLEPGEGEGASDRDNGGGVTEREVVGKRADPFEALLARRAANAGLRVNMDEIIEEEKQDREERSDRWLFPQS